MQRFVLALGISLLITSTNVRAETILNNIQYGSKERNQLDLYFPDNAENPPLVVFIHGGRWFRNDKSQIGLYGRVESLMDAGIALASINYTYSSQEIWPAQLEDVKTAISYLREHSTEYRFDPSKIAVWGQSSGAHMALWAGLNSANDPETMLKAVVSWYAPSDLYNLEADRYADGVHDEAGRRPREGATGQERKEPPKTPEAILIGAEVADNKELADAASPAVYISNLTENKKLPDFLLMHGTQDSTVSPLQSKRLYEALKKQNGAARVELQYVEGAGHGGDLFIPQVKESVDFLIKSFDRM